MWWPWHNLRYTSRVLGKNPGFTAAAVLSLALGMGANTAIFTLIDALLLRDLPVRQPVRLVELSAIRRNAKTPFSFPMFREVERGQRVFTALIGWGDSLVNVEVNGEPSQGYVLGVTGNYYSELGARPFLGRLITSDDVNASNGTNSPVAVLGYAFWQRRFSGASDVVGRAIRIEGQSFTIIGVTRKWFTGMTTGEPPEVTIPISFEPVIQSSAGTFNIDDRSVLWLSVTGRLKDGVTIAQARAQLQSFWPEVLTSSVPTQIPGPRRQAFLSMGLDVSPVATGVATDLRSQFTRPLYVLIGIVGLILLVACLNLANLMLARTAARSHEMSVRVALGANRWVIVRQVLTESLALSVAGALLGLIFAYWGGRWLVALMTEEYLIPVTLDLAPDFRVFSVTASVAIVTGILFGLAPAWRCARKDPASVLQQNAPSLAGGSGRMSKGLAVAQVALSLVLVLFAGLLLSSFQRLRSVDLGFDRHGLLEVMLYPRPGGYLNLDMNSYHKLLIERVSNVPGVRSVCFARDPIPSRIAYRDDVSVMSTDSNASVNVVTSGTMVSPGFFGTLGIGLVRGRDFSWTDDENHPRVAIVSSTLAERLFSNGDAIGMRIRFGVMPDFQNLEIVGIANNARVSGLRDGAASVIYLSSLQYPKRTKSGDLFVRTDGAPEGLAKTVGDEIESLGHEYPLRTETMEETLSHLLVEERITAILAGFFAGLALLLASVGLYGLMSYAVTCRTREIGIRVALGAQKANILWIVLRETLLLALLGLALGVPCALAASRLISSMLFGLSPNDFSTIVAVSTLLFVVALFAGYLPARKASAIDPVVALRME